jgi:hypothetical protein
MAPIATNDWPYAVDRRSVASCGVRLRRVARRMSMSPQWNSRRAPVPWPVVASSLWLRAGFAFAGVAALGVAMLADAANGTPLLGLSLALGGGVLAYAAIRRAWSLLARCDPPASSSRASAPSLHGVVRT